MKKTKVFFQEYNGRPIFSIWYTNLNDQKIDNYPIISFGLEKAKAILAHKDQLIDWINNSNNDIDQNLECTICFSNFTRPNKILLPCGHACFCNSCILSIGEKCPICNIDIVKINKIFY